MDSDDDLDLLLRLEEEVMLDTKPLPGQSSNNHIKIENQLSNLIEDDTFTKTLVASTSNGFSDILNKSLTKNELSSNLLATGLDSSDDEDASNFLERKYNEYGQDIQAYLKRNHSEKAELLVEQSVKRSIRESNSIPEKIPNRDCLTIDKIDKLSNKIYKPNDNVGIYTDPVFGIRIIHPLISSSLLQERMKDRIAVSTAGIANHIQHYDLKNDWAVAGVVISKGPITTSKKGSKYIIWKLSDLRGEVKTFSLFLFNSACKDLWKTALGMVVAILNPKVFESKHTSNDVACLSVDNSQKFMILGQSKDMGFCKSKKRNGEICNIPVNMNTCEYCIYHVKQEYGKMSGRSELQSATGGHGLAKLRNKVLGKSEVFYGGQSFSAVPARKNPKLIAKDQKRLITLSEYHRSPNTQSGSSSVMNNKKDVVPYAKSNKIESKIAAGLDLNVKQRQQDYDRLKQLSGVKAENTSGPLNKSNLIEKNILITGDQKPTLKKEQFSFELTVNLKKSDISKTKAIEILKKKPIEKSNPNFIKYRGTENGKKRALEEIVSKDENECKKQKLTDEAEKFRNERIQKIMQASSSHKDLIENHEKDVQEKYFNKLEKKEAMEEKMLGTFKIDCKAVICIKCKYTAFSAADRCKVEKHPLKIIDAEKRFFQCMDCGNRTATLNRIPTLSCKNCQSSRWQRTAMIRDRKTEQFGEGLSIRGDEEKFIGSLVSKSNINLCVSEDNNNL